MNKQPEVTQKTRQKFVDVFCALYTEKPIEKISVQQITNLAGYNRSTFYQYFSDIYKLRDYAENDVLTFITEEFSRGADDGCFRAEGQILRKRPFSVSAGIPYFHASVPLQALAVAGQGSAGAGTV